MDNLTFDKEWHCYKLNNIPMGGVSSILKRAGLIDLSGIPEDVLNRARDFGTAVHMACELADKGMLDRDSLDQALTPYLLAWEKAKEEMSLDIKAIEMPVYSKRWWYAGTLDRVAMQLRSIPQKPKRVLVDIKSSSTVYPSMKIQLAGYQIAWEEMNGQKIDERWVVQLLKTGQYRVHQYKDPADLQVFLSAVQISKFKRKEKDYYEKKQ